jgi:acyl-CoA thioesterase
MDNNKDKRARAYELIEKIPFNRLLGIEVSRFHADGVTLRCRIRKELLNSHGAVHGGVTASLADVGVGVAIHCHSAVQRPVSTVELKVNYLLPVTEGVLYARSRLLRIGSTLCVGRVDLTDSQRKAVGTAIVTYIFLDARGAVRGADPLVRGQPPGRAARIR